MSCLAGLESPISRNFERAGIGALLTIAVLSACGGGGSGAASSPSNPVVGNPPAPPAPVVRPSLTLSDTDLVAGVDVTDPTPSPMVVQAAISSPPTSNLNFVVSGDGDAIATSNFGWDSSASGKLTVTFPNPVQAGPGTHRSTIHLNICLDSACTQPITGSPVDIKVTYTVSQAASATTSFYFYDLTGYFPSTTADTAPQTAKFLVNVSNIPSSGLYFLLDQPPSGYVTGGTYSVSPLSNGSVDLTLSLALKSPSSLGSGVFDGSYTFKMCFDWACKHQVSGSPVTQPVKYSVFLSEGREYTRRVVNDGSVADVTYNAATSKLYVSALNYLTGLSGGVAEVDPTTGAVGPKHTFGENLGAVTSSDDGQFVYVASLDQSVVHRLKLPALTPDIDIPLGSSNPDGVMTRPHIAGDLLAVPGSPHAFAVPLAYNGSIQTGGTKIFDDMIPRSQMLTSVGSNASPDALSWSDTPNLLYAYRYSYQLPVVARIDAVTINGTGMTVDHSFPVDLSSDGVGKILFSAGKIYDLYGFVRDASNGNVLGRFKMPFDATILTMIPDALHHRAFFLVRVGTTSHALLLSFDSNTFALLSMIDLQLDYSTGAGSKTRLILWGTDGVALSRGGLQILSGSFYGPPVLPTARGESESRPTPVFSGSLHPE